MLNELPFNHYVNDDDYYSAISYLRTNGTCINYEKLNSLVFNTFETNTDVDASLPNHAYDPDINCQMYKTVANDLLNTCDYHTEDTFVETSKQFHLSDLSMLHCNIRSLAANTTELNSFLQNLKHKFKIIGLSETWLNKCNRDLHSIDGYTPVHFVRDNIERVLGCHFILSRA